MKTLYRSFLVIVFFWSFHSVAYHLDEYAKDLASLNSQEKELFFSAASELKCPTCTTLSVLGSDTVFSMAIREKILDLVKSKKSSEEIKSFFVERYGLWLLRMPPKEGLHLVLWMIPALFLVFLLLLILFFISGKKSFSFRSSRDKDIEALFEADLKLFKQQL